MPHEGLDKHQLAGLDDRERGFSRTVELERVGDCYRAILRYETVLAITESHPTQDIALLTLIQSLHARGYRQLKTQMSFHSGVYLGSQEGWVEYRDPLPLEPKPSGYMAKILNWLRPGPRSTQP